MAVHIEKLLQTLQSKHDFMPKDSLSLAVAGGKKGPESSNACNSVCKALLHIMSAVRSCQGELTGLNLVEDFWKPLGRMLVGTLISHVKRYKISIEGAKILTRDIEEYYNVSVTVII